VINRVEARLDVSLEHPLVRVNGEKMDLGDGVLCAPLRPEAVTRRLEVRLENRLQYQLERRLNHSVAGGGDA
jgi:hypothetical protein